MALKGSLRDVGLNQLFNLIHLAHKTGALTVQNSHGAGSARLYFKEGRLVQASPDGKETRVTDMLVQIDRLTPEQATLIRSRSSLGTDKELGLLMMQLGILSQKEIIQGIQSHILSIVYQLFNWTEGSFRFDPNQLPSEERITVPIELDHLILEGGRRAQEWEHLREELPDLDVPLRFIEHPTNQIHSIRLTADQWKVVACINSRNTIRQIADVFKLDEHQIRRIVYGLKSAGLVEVMVPALSAPPPRPGASPRKSSVSRGVLLRVIDRIRRL